ncbi:MAG: tripartite tricarboxylate transporter substrate binding protein [Pigmentiphaga sp.]|uniref:Bug family tripartite tricarboxylate transporter substrate binding protein n=1 Tax=Pigmentiphaga sp. TaxID=1977564 RepID=UPI0029BB88FB|nr:tripartite tricarboxylate transporter substrate binding protein [Pigmentiphaga sp.]MDX3907036.1 tripartite tricarboxylate transporter substrate binding protein [Pigmentiphaga sp.]
MGKIAKLFMGAMLALAVTAQAGAATYPDKPIRLIIPYAAGGTTDILGRVVGEKLSVLLGQPVVVENKPGANSMIGTAQVARAPHDGYTLLLTANSVILNEFLYEKPTYNAMTDLTPVALVASTPYFVIVNGQLPVHSVADLIKLAKQRPGEIAFGSSGKGGTPHLVGELFQAATGTELLHVPYKGTGPAVVDLAAGQVQVMFVGLPATAPYIQKGTLRLLATAEAERSVFKPDLPTVKEAGFDGVSASNWFGILGPAGLPPAVVDRIATAMATIAKTDAFKDEMAKLGAEPLVKTPAEFAALYQADRARWQKLIGTNKEKFN